jgi:response regulator NasT
MTSSNPITAKSVSILLVDDDRLVIATIAEGLSDCGYKVITAESADEAESILAAGERPSLAIVDISMPGRSGLELASRLEQFDRIPFIFLTAYSDKQFVDQAAQYGALSYIVKPVDPARLVPVVESALARSAELNKLRKSESSLQEALHNDRQISIAIGVTMMQRGLGRKAAFEYLRDMARRERRKLSDCAKDVISAAETTNFNLSPRQSR